MLPRSWDTAAQFYSDRACYPIGELPEGSVTISAAPDRAASRCCLWLCMMPGRALVSCRESLTARIEDALGDIAEPSQLLARSTMDRLIQAVGNVSSVYDGAKLVCDESTVRPTMAEGIRRLTVEDAPMAIHDLSSVEIPNDTGYLLHDGCAHASFVGNCAVSFAATHPSDTEAIANMMVGTLPEFRKQGHGRAVASATTGEVLRRGKVALWGSESANIAAIRTAESCGFEHFCQVLEVREE